MASKKNRRSGLKIFFTTSFISFMLMIMGVGFIIADYNTRNMGFGNGSLRLEVNLENNNIDINILGREKSIAIPKPVSEWSGRVWNILPPGIRAAFWFFESEYDAVPKLVEAINN